jgi:hypothetical protein
MSYAVDVWKYINNDKDSWISFVDNLSLEDAKSLSLETVSRNDNYYANIWNLSGKGKIVEEYNGVKAPTCEERNEISKKKR